MSCGGRYQQSYQSSVVEERAEWLKKRESDSDCVSSTEFPKEKSAKRRDFRRVEMMSADPPLLEEWQISEAEAEVGVVLDEAFKSAGVAKSPRFNPQSLGFLSESNGAPMPGILEGWLRSKRLDRSNNRLKSSVFLPRSVSASAVSGGSLPYNHHSSCNPESPPESPAPTSESATPSAPALPPPHFDFWARLETAVELDIRPLKVDWTRLVALHRTEHEGDEEEDATALGVTVNSGGIVYFALFNISQDPSLPKMAAACLKFAPSRLATQSEKLGSELARHLHVATPQARVIHSSSPEWGCVSAGVEAAQAEWRGGGESVENKVCEEVLEALRLSRCLLFMGFVRGKALQRTLDAPLSPSQFGAEKTAEALGRVLLLDLLLRNEDRLLCHRLGWRGNADNILYTTQALIHTPTISKADGEEAGDEGLNARDGRRKSKSSEGVEKMIGGSEGKRNGGEVDKEGNGGSGDGEGEGFGEVVAIDSGVCRRPPSLKVKGDMAEYPRMVELLLNHSGTAREILQEVSGGRLGGGGESRGGPREEGGFNSEVEAFQKGFREGLGDLERLGGMLTALRRRLDEMLRAFIAYVNTVSPQKEPRSPRRTCASRLGRYGVSPKPEEKREEGSENESSRRRWSAGGGRALLPDLSAAAVMQALEIGGGEEEGGRRDRGGGGDLDDKQEAVCGRSDEDGGMGGMAEGGGGEPTCPTDSCERRVGGDGEDVGLEEGMDAPSSQRAGEGGKQEWYRHLPSRLTMRVRGVKKSVAGDESLRGQLEWWNGLMREEGHRICSAHGFTTGFLEGGGAHSMVDSYELKVRLDHILERCALIWQGAATERPSEVVPRVFIGGSVAARSVATLERLGVSHILSLCPSDVLDTPAQQNPSAFRYLLCQVRDVEEENIGAFFEEACAFADEALASGGHVLIHCFEGRSRSGAVVLAYLMMRRKMALSDAWALLKTAHPRAQPNDGFMRTLVALDRQLLGGVSSMEWRNRKPQPRVCPVCHKMAGFSGDSLRTHLKKKHPGTLQRADGAPVVADPKRAEGVEGVEGVEGMASSPIREGGDVVHAHHESPRDVAEQRLLAVVGIVGDVAGLGLDGGRDRGLEVEEDKQ